MSDTVKPALLGMVPVEDSIGAEWGRGKECWVYVRAGRLELHADTYQGQEGDESERLLTLNREQALTLGALLLAAAPLLPAPLVLYEAVRGPVLDSRDG